MLARLLNEQFARPSVIEPAALPPIMLYAVRRARDCAAIIIRSPVSVDFFQNALATNPHSDNAPARALRCIGFVVPHMISTSRMDGLLLQILDQRLGIIEHSARITLILRWASISTWRQSPDEPERD